MSKRPRLLIKTKSDKNKKNQSQHFSLTHSYIFLLSLIFSHSRSHSKRVSVVIIESDNGCTGALSSVKDFTNILTYRGDPGELRT